MLCKSQQISIELADLIAITVSGYNNCYIHSD
jgi:hypothetical protein